VLSFYRLLEFYIFHAFSFPGPKSTTNSLNCQTHYSILFNNRRCSLKTHNIIGKYRQHDMARHKKHHIIFYFMIYYVAPYLSKTAFAKHFQEVKVVDCILSEPRYAGGRRNYTFRSRMVPITVGTKRSFGPVRISSTTDLV